MRDEDEKMGNLRGYAERAYEGRVCVSGLVFHTGMSDKDRRSGILARLKLNVYLTIY